MKKTQTVNIRGRLEAEVARILRAIPGVAVDAEPPERADKDRFDAVVEFAGTNTQVVVEFKSRANAATARQAVHWAQANPELPLILVAGETTEDARRILVDHDIAVVDSLGNAYIELPGLLFDREGSRRGRRATVDRSSKPSLSGKAGIAAQALLIGRDREWHVNDLAGEAGVSTALAHRVLVRLEEEGVVETEGAGPQRVRRVANPAALLDLWAEEQQDKPRRTRAYLLAQTPQQLVNELGASLQRAEIDYALTGAAGATLVAPFITAVPVAEVWVEAIAAPEDLYDAARADPVDEGQNVVFLQAKDDAPLAFREQVKRTWIANRFRLFRDLRQDPRRGREQADNLRSEVIGF